MNALLILPFAIILLCIGIAPLTIKPWWERNYPYVVISLALATAVYYLIAEGSVDRMAHALHDYACFIIFPTALFCVSGGIYISLSNFSTPTRNIILLVIGIVLTNFLGVTGTSLLLIRPFLRTNKYRLRAFHIILFIFIIGNTGGMLTPIGEAPLFMGYIKGVPFFWSLVHLWQPWIAINSVLLGLFYILDVRAYNRLDNEARAKVEVKPEKLAVAGLHNLIFLAVVIAAVFIQQPIFLREAILLAMAAASYFTTSKTIHRNNQFSFRPMKEVAILFFGIFITMAPALQWIEMNAATMNLHSPGQYFWITGVASSILDNAPAYISFLAAALGTYGMHINDAGNIAAFIAQHGQYLTAISLGAVIFGAATPIGNSSNFMILALVEHDGASVPNFGRYIAKYALPILLPVLALVYWWFI